jgi:hypothetical protein
VGPFVLVRKLLDLATAHSLGLEPRRPKGGRVSVSAELSSEAFLALRLAVGLAPPGGLLLLFRDEDAYTGPAVMPHPWWGSRAQRDHTYICCDERIPCFEVIPHDLCAGIGRG